MSVRVGVMLSGCGVYDGSEIHEAVSVLIALDKRGATAMCMAPDVAQLHVVNHLSGKPAQGVRLVLEESARIARGKVRDAGKVTAEDMDALVFPGGFGAAKNLCTFALDGPGCTVNADVRRLVQQMHAARKPIGLACIAPVLAAKILGAIGTKPGVTIGTDKGTAAAISAMGGEHHNTGPTDIYVDEVNKLVTTPCYMNDVGPWTVYQGAEKMVEAVLRMAGSR